MAEQWGGYRQPSNPAPVSGPGALSQRTDGGAVEGMSAPTQGPKYMPGLNYGEGGNMDQQQAAPMAGTEQVYIPKPVVPLSAPSERPEEPITAGINFGPGPGREANPLPNRAPTLIDTVRQLTTVDPSGDSELLYRHLQDSGYVQGF